MKNTLSALGWLCVLLTQAFGADKPNIVLILSDDIGYGDTSCYGATAVATPNIDRLAAEGLRFTDVHAPASVCTPTRYALLTGQYAWRKSGTGILSGLDPLCITPGTVTLPGMLRRAGYTTAAIGKWHLGWGVGTPNYNTTNLVPGPLEVGFDSCFCIPATGDRVPCVFIQNHAVANYNPANPLLISYTSKVGSQPTGSERPDLLRYMYDSTSHAGTIINHISRIGWMDGMTNSWWVDENIADTLTQHATNFVAQHTNSPFFLYLATHDIHVPFAPHPRFFGSSGCDIRMDAIRQLDWCVGQVLAQLDALNLATNTLVIFTSDNGARLADGYLDGSETNPCGHLYNGILRGIKGTFYEGGNREPFIARWPGHIPVGTNSAMFSLHDLLPTVAALVGQPLPTDAGPDAQNVLPALLGQTSQSPRSALVMQNNGSSPLAVRQDAWKLLPSSSELYNLANDVREATNVFAQNPQRVATLNALLAQIKNTPASSSLVAWWPMNDAAGTVARDLSGSGFSAQATNSPAWSPQGNFTCLSFNGTNQYLTADGLPALTNRLTAACWARSSATNWNASGCLIARRPQFVLNPVQNTKRLGLTVIRAGGQTQSLEFDLGSLNGFDLTQWHHYAASYDAATGDARIYADGILRTNATLTPGSLGAGTGPITIAADAVGGGGSFGGELADTRVYSDVLTDQRVANMASGILIDSDHDGMLDDWEVRYGLDPFNASDANGDPDGDGLTNLTEFLQGTSPLVPNSIVPGGLLGYWRFDETNGSIATDASGQAHNGSLSNTPAWTSGPGRRYLKFNGVNQFVDVGGLPNLNVQVTAACWARSHVTNWNAAGFLLSRRPQFVLHPWLNPAGSNRVSLIVTRPDNTEASADVDLATFPSFSITNWHHYAGTYDATSGQIRLYVDGFLRAATNITPTLLRTNTGPLQMGKDVTYSRYFNGDIDEARLYNRVLSPNEIFALTAGFDDNQDGLPDDFQRRIIEANSTDNIRTLDDVQPGDDFDGDGASNYEEYIAGTDPVNPADRFGIASFQLDGIEAAFTVQLAGHAGRIYTLERCAAPGGAWVTVDEVGPVAADGTVGLSEPQTPGPAGFYRVQVRITP